MTNPHPITKEHRKRISQALKGRKRKASTKKKIADARRSLTPKQCRKIVRLDHVDDYTQLDLADMYNVGAGTISAILNHPYKYMTADDYDWAVNGDKDAIKAAKATSIEDNIKRLKGIGR